MATKSSGTKPNPYAGYVPSTGSTLNPAQAAATKPATKAANQTAYNPRATQTPSAQHPTQQQPAQQAPQNQPRPAAGDPAGGGATQTRTKAGSVPQQAPTYTGPSWGQTPPQPVATQYRPAIGTNVPQYTGPSWGNTQPAGTRTQPYTGPGWANTQPEGTKPVPYQGPSWGNTQPNGTPTLIYQGPSWGNTQNGWTRADFEAWRRGERDLTMPRLPIPPGLGGSGNFDRNPYNDQIIYPTVPAPVVDPAGGIVYPDGYAVDGGGGYTDYYPQGYGDGYGGGGWGGRGGWGNYDPYPYEPKDWFVGMQSWRF